MIDKKIMAHPAVSYQSFAKIESCKLGIKNEILFLFYDISFYFPKKQNVTDKRADRQTNQHSGLQKHDKDLCLHVREKKGKNPVSLTRLSETERCI